MINLPFLCCYEPKFCRVFSDAAGADQEQGTSGWFAWPAWCPTSERLLEIAESQILRSKIEFLVQIFEVLTCTKRFLVVVLPVFE